MRTPLYKETIPTTTTVYVPLPIHDGVCGAYIAWLDAVAAATITVQFTSFPNEKAPVTTAGTYQWKDSGLTFTGPAASAAGSLMINIENVRQSRARIKIVTTAISPIEIYEGPDHP